MRSFCTMRLITSLLLFCSEEGEAQEEKSLAVNGAFLLVQIRSFLLYHFFLLVVKRISFSKVVLEQVRT